MINFRFITIIVSYNRPIVDIMSVKGGNLSGAKPIHAYDAKEIRLPTNMREPLEVHQAKQMWSTTD